MENIRLSIQNGLNEWFARARLSKKGQILSGEQTLEHDILEVFYRYGSQPLEAIQPWLEYKFGVRLSNDGASK